MNKKLSNGSIKELTHVPSRDGSSKFYITNPMALLTDIVTKNHTTPFSVLKSPLGRP